jgi:hypothetical protein
VLASLGELELVQQFHVLRNRVVSPQRNNVQFFAWVILLRTVAPWKDKPVSAEESLLVTCLFSVTFPAHPLAIKKSDNILKSWSASVAAEKATATSSFDEFILV